MNTPEYDQKLVEMAALAGEVMIRSGAETHRVEDTLSRILCMASGANAEALVLTTGFVVTLHGNNHEPLSITKRVAGTAQNLGRVCFVNKVSRDFCSGKIDIDAAMARLTEISTERQYKNWQVILGLIAASSFFTILFGGSLLDAAGAVLCGLMLAFIMLVLGPKINRSFFTTLLCAAAITICSTATAYCLNLWFDLRIQSQYMVVGAMMPLVPGLALTNAIRDTLQGDYISAGSRAIEALMIAASVALGVGAGMELSNILGISYVLDFSFALSAGDTITFIKAIVACFLAVLGFAVVFEIPRKYCLATGAVAIFSWAIFLTCDSLALSAPWASFFAAMVADLCAYILARTLKAPVIIFLIGGILPLVPGLGIYRAVYDLIYRVGGDATGLTETLLITGAIALAIFLMDTLIDMEKRIRRNLCNKTKNKQQ